MRSRSLKESGVGSDVVERLELCCERRVPSLAAADLRGFGRRRDTHAGLELAHRHGNLIRLDVAGHVLHLEVQ